MHIGLGLRIPQRRLCVPAASFEGILDTLATSPVVAYAPGWTVKTSYLGSNLGRLRDTTDNDEFNYADAGDGIADTAAVTTALGGHSGAFVTVNDHVGSANITQGTAANQPGYAVVAGLNNRVAAVNADGADRLTANLPSNWSGNQNHCLVWVGRVYASDPGDFHLAVAVGNSSFSSGIGHNTTSWWYGGSFLLGANNYGGTADANYHVFVKRHQAGTTRFWVDGSLIESASNTYNFSGTTAVNFGGDGLTGGTTSTTALLLAFSTDITDGDQAILEAALADFYGL